LALIEAAPAGSLELDAAIAAALDVAAAPYSQSLDAALQLVPDGWAIAQLSQRTDGRGRVAGWTAELYRPSIAVLPDAPPRVMASAPLALAIACFRARIERPRPVRAA
jgi:hypothetical protein